MEIKVIPSLTGYGASRDGTIWSCRNRKNWRPMTPSSDKDGYKLLIIRTKEKCFSRKIHRLIVEAFIGEIPEGLCVNHKDGNKANNNLDNLEVVTHLENMRHAYKLGLIKIQKNTLLAQINKSKTHCPHGHLYDNLNTYITKQGHRLCRTCGKLNKRRYYRFNQA